MTRTLKTRVDSLISGLKRDGPAYLLHAVRWRVPRWLFYYNHSVLVEADNPRLVAREYAGYTVRAADSRDIDAIARVDIYPRQKIVDRLAGGDGCHIALAGERVVCVIWGKVGRLYSVDSGMCIDTGDGGCFLYGLFVLPEERMKGFHVACLKSLYESYVRAGRNRIMGVIHYSNAASVRAHRSMNFTVSGETFFLILLGVSICYYRLWPGKRSRVQILFKRPPRHHVWV